MAVRRAVLLALALAVLAAGVALGATGEHGDGVVVTRAVPADDVAHPGSRTEWWYVHAHRPGHGPDDRGHALLRAPPAGQRLPVHRRRR